LLAGAADNEVVEKAVVPPCPPASGFVMADNMSHRDAESGQCLLCTAFNILGWSVYCGEMLAWLSVWGEVQICIWPSRCHCHSLSIAPVNPDWFYLQKSRKTILCVCVCVHACVRACMSVVSVLLQPFYGSVDFVQDYPGELVLER